jgi:hypothetical protein
MNSKGQFSIISALLVAVVLISTVMITYSMILNNSIQVQPQVLSPIDETNFAIKQILGFAVGYYGSVIKVTGDVGYAREKTTNYTNSGLEFIANTHPDWGASFSLTNLTVQTQWYGTASYSTGSMDVAYNLTKLGIYGIRYVTSCGLNVQITKVASVNQTSLEVTKDKDEPLINLGKQNFKFYRYESVNSTWELIDPASEPTAYSNGTYQLDVPTTVNPYAYFIQVEDPRGLMVVASASSRYTYALNWTSIYANATLQDPTLVVELMQNGTMRYLGQDLAMTAQENITSPIPIPPIPVKALRVNQTINSVDQQVRFQIEDWSSNYRVPLGLTSNTSVFNSRTLLVFLINPNVSKITLWWDGQDVANQTSYAALTDKYFQFTNVGNQLTLNNGKLLLKVDWSGAPLIVQSTVGSQTATAVLMRITKNGTAQWASPSWPIINGTVRAVVQGEVEWGSSSSYQIPSCPNFYAHMVLTIPTNATYYTYQLRLMFMESEQDRDITDLCPISLTFSANQAQTEDGRSVDGYPIVSNASALFYNVSIPETAWALHHWSQLVSGTKGAGIMFTDNANQWLYAFDTIAGQATGAIKANSAGKRIELLPVSSLASASFKTALDVTWHGAVVTFKDTTPIYNNGDGTGLWMIAEYPPAVTVSTES